MTSKPVAFLLADLGVTKTPSRPRVLNDNPFTSAPTPPPSSSPPPGSLRSSQSRWMGPGITTRRCSSIAGGCPFHPLPHLRHGRAGIRHHDCAREDQSQNSPRLVAVAVTTVLAKAMKFEQRRAIPLERIESREMVQVVERVNPQRSARLQTAAAGCDDPHQAPASGNDRLDPRLHGGHGLAHPPAPRSQPGADRAGHRKYGWQSIFRGYTVWGSFLRSAVNFQAGAVTGLSSAFANVVAVITLLFLTPLLCPLP